KATTGSDFHEVAHLSNFHRLRIRTVTKSMNEPKNIALENICRSPHRSSVMQANSPTSKLSGKIVLVTGGTSGIGLATQKNSSRGLHCPETLDVAKAARNVCSTT